MKKFKKAIKKTPKKLATFIMLFVMLFSALSSITNVIADTNANLSVNLTQNSHYTVDSMTVNNEDWVDAQTPFNTTNGSFHIEINVTGNANTEGKEPVIGYGGNWTGHIETGRFINQTDNTKFQLIVDIDINSIPEEERNNYTFIDLTLSEQDSQPAQPINNDPQPGNNQQQEEPHFDGKAYVIWSCGSGVCYHYFDNIPNFTGGNSTFYKDTDIKADNDNSITFDVKAQYQAWALKDKFLTWVNSYKTKNNITGEIDWTRVDPEDIIGNNPPHMEEWEEKAIKAGACTRPETDDAPSRVAFETCIDQYYVTESGNLPFIRLQPVGEPTDNNAYVSYGDRNFKVVIYNSKYKGITIGDLSDLKYYPAEWSNPFIRQDQFDISGTTKEKPTAVNAILLEKTLNIKALNENGFEITKLEALDVPDDAVEITKVNGEWKLVFSSHFYDYVVFKATDKNGEVSYFAVKRYTVDAWINNVEGKPHYYAEVYYDRNNTYSDFDLTAKITYKDGTTENVKLTHYNKIDDGLGNITISDEVDQENTPYGEDGKGLKKAVFVYKLPEGKTDRDIKVAYTNIEYKGSTKTTYAGAFAGSGKGVLANIYQGEGE